MDGLPLAARTRVRASLAFALLVCLCALALLSSVGVSAGRADQADPEAVPGQLVVGFKPTATDRQQVKAVDKVGGTIETTLDSIDSAVVSVDPGEIDTAAQELTRQWAVSYVEPNYVVRATRVPNDHMFGEQWALRNL